MSETFCAYTYAAGFSYSNGVDDILGEQDALELDQEKVHQLRDVLEHGLGGFLGDGVIATRPERASDALLEDDMARDLHGGGHYGIQSVARSKGHGSHAQLTSKRHVQKLEGPAEEGQVASCENKTDDAGIGNGGRTGLFPLYTRGVSELGITTSIGSRQLTLKRLYSREW